MRKVAIFLVLVVYTCLPSISRGASSSPIDEYHLLKTPDLSPTGTAFVSWFFLRKGSVWQNGVLTNLQTLPWPAWDKDQIPARLVPAPKQKTTLIVLDNEQKELDRIELKESFSPLDFKSEQGKEPSHYRVILELNDGRIEVTGPTYPWISPKKIARCEVELGDSESNLGKNRKLQRA